jgi:hypothetical protein
MVYFWPFGIFRPFGIFIAIWYSYGHLVFLRPSGIFTAIWFILLPIGTFYGCLVYFSCFVMLYQEKSGNPTFFIFFVSTHRHLCNYLNFIFFVLNFISPICMSIFPSLFLNVVRNPFNYLHTLAHHRT